MVCNNLVLSLIVLTLSNLVTHKEAFSMMICLQSDPPTMHPLQIEVRIAARSSSSFHFFHFYQD